MSMDVKRGQPGGDRVRGNDAPPAFLRRGAQEPAAAAPAEKVRPVAHSEGEQIASHLEAQEHHEPRMQSGAGHAEFQPQRQYEGVPITTAQAAQVASEVFGFAVVDTKPSAVRAYAASFGRIALATSVISVAVGAAGYAAGEGAHIMTYPAFAGASAALFAQPLRAIGQGIINVVKRPFQKMAEAKAQRQAEKAEKAERAERQEPTISRVRGAEIPEEPHMGDLDAAVADHLREPTGPAPEVRLRRGAEAPEVSPTLTEGGPSRGVRARVTDD